MRSCSVAPGMTPRTVWPFKINGSAYIVGATTSPDFPVTSQAFQTSLPSISGAVFVAKLSPQGDSLVYSTYLGGTGGASGTAIAVDREGALSLPDAGPSGFPAYGRFLGGSLQLLSLGQPLRPQTIAGGFVARLNTTGTLTLLHAGGRNARGPHPQFRRGRLRLWRVLPYLGGLNQYTLQVGNSPNMIVTRLTPNGARADMTVAMSCIGHLHSAGLLALDSRNNILVAGSSACATFPSGTTGAFQPQHTPVGTPTFNSTPNTMA